MGRHNPDMMMLITIHLKDIRCQGVGWTEMAHGI